MTGEEEEQLSQTQHGDEQTEENMKVEYVPENEMYQEGETQDIVDESRHQEQQQGDELNHSNVNGEAVHMGNEGEDQIQVHQEQSLGEMQQGEESNENIHVTTEHYAVQEDGEVQPQDDGIEGDEIHGQNPDDEVMTNHQEDIGNSNQNMEHVVDDEHNPEHQHEIDGHVHEQGESQNVGELTEPENSGHMQQNINEFEEQENQNQIENQGNNEVLHQQEQHIEEDLEQQGVAMEQDIHEQQGPNEDDEGQLQHVSADGELSQEQIDDGMEHQQHQGELEGNIQQEVNNGEEMQHENQGEIQQQDVNDIQHEGPENEGHMQEDMNQHHMEGTGDQMVSHEQGEMGNEGEQGHAMHGEGMENDMQQDMQQDGSHQHMVQEDGTQVMDQGHEMQQQHRMHHDQDENAHYHQGDESMQDQGTHDEHNDQHHQSMHDQSEMMQDGHHSHGHHQHMMEQGTEMDNMNEVDMHGAYDEDQVMGQQQEQIRREMARMPTDSIFASLSTRKRLNNKEQKKLKADGFKVRFENVIYKRQLLLTKTRLNYALQALQFVKMEKPYQKLAALAMDERRCLKEIAPLLATAKPLLQVKQDTPNTEQQQYMRTVDTKKGERQRPLKYNTKSKEEMSFIAAAADAVVSGVCTLREAKDALQEVGAVNFETSLSNKIYNHKDKQQYLKNRVRSRNENIGYSKSVMSHRSNKKRSVQYDNVQNEENTSKMARTEEEIHNDEYMQQQQVQQMQQANHQQPQQGISQHIHDQRNQIQYAPMHSMQQLPQPQVMMMMASAQFPNQAQIHQQYVPAFQGQQQYNNQNPVATSNHMTQQPVNQQQGPATNTQNQQQQTVNQQQAQQMQEML